jgi:glycosyltransferase involved in cell wall biosynthesis
LRSLQAARRAFDPWAWSSELIVCDNNSTDRTAEIARTAGARVVTEAVNQIGRARNTGAAAATGEWLLFIDADSRPSPELFTDLAAAIQRGDCLAGGSTVRLDQFHLVPALVTSAWNWLSRITRWAPGSFFFSEAAAFRELGGVSGALYAAEERDLSRRLKRLAAGRGRRMVILHRHPMITSSRKLRLYSPREHLRFLRRLILTRGRALRDPVQCHSWYDGRR